jgi:hypothetical protein
MKFVKPCSCLDPVLENLALSLDRSGGEVAVVLHVEGSIVAGKLIGQKQYIDLHHETMKKLVPGQEERLDSARDLAHRVHKERGKVEAPPVLLLKDVILAQGNNKIKLPLWRARLDAISGWYFGFLEDDFLDTTVR